MSTRVETDALIGRIRLACRREEEGFPNERTRAMVLALEKIEGGAITKREMVSLAHAALKPFVLPRALP